MKLRSPYRQGDGSHSQETDAMRFRFVRVSSALRCAFEVLIAGLWSERS
ncbi:hypothetical protein GLA29479_1741 [Lysobacter antibioticus]|nr:hypothetical protein GLA29479_1741 [Lysobacter antibioticus]